MALCCVAVSEEVVHEKSQREAGQELHLRQIVCVTKEDLGAAKMGVDLRRPRPSRAAHLSEYALKTRETKQEIEE